MGSNQVDDYFPLKKQDTEQMAYGEIIKRLAPDYLAMGMSLSEYYDGDPDWLEDVRKAHELRLKQANHDAWLHGLYVYNALKSVSPLFRDWVKDHTPDKYPLEPFDLYPSKTDAKSEQKEQDDKDLKNQATIRAWVDRVNRLQNQKNKEGVANG